MKNLESFESFASEEIELSTIGGDALIPTSYSGADGATGSDYYDDVNQRVVYLNN
ncbi:MAG TPA: hypothetical protein VIN08_05660 [Ohtaekwangia sp.]|uniref:hypothetical protein n=1 Tax=Ohtaekwangia sp. TaxID=2066019 RepID=UPI002F94436F